MCLGASSMGATLMQLAATCCNYTLAKVKDGVSKLFEHEETYITHVQSENFPDDFLDNAFSV